MPSKDEARRTLCTLVRLELERIDGIRERLQVNVEEPALEARLFNAEVDSSPDGMRLARYDAMSELSFHRNWKELVPHREGVMLEGVDTFASREGGTAAAYIHRIELLE